MSRDPKEKLIGINPVLEALKAGRPIQRILVAEHRRRDRDVQTILRLAQDVGIELRFAGRDSLNREAPGAQNQGIVAFASAKKFASLDDILRIPGARGEVPLLLVLDGVEDPRNLGAILRTADAAGVHGVIIPERRAAGMSETVSKTAAGAVEHVALVKVVNIVNTLEELKEAGIWIAGAEADGDMEHWDADFSQPLALVLGGEDRGVRRLVRERCDFLVSLPLRGKISSLNVSVAAGVLLYEALRQRSLKIPLTGR